ncbi:MAG: NFACT RNA binding domain-containing protein [archaeon]|nr:NFACT RNA binding domain-containing protein [archaeon]
MKFREIILSSGTRIFLGKNAEDNDELVKQFQGKENILLHTEKPGSPFCVIDSLKPGKEEIKEAAIITASKSQDWRDNKKDVKINIFNGKNVHKEKIMKSGTWGIKGKVKRLTIKKEEILDLK